MQIALIQPDPIWEQPAANRKRLQALLDTLDPGTELVVLPEMFSSGFSMDMAPRAETMDGPTVDWMLSTAGRLGAALCGSLAIRDEGGVYNRFLLACPDGGLHRYDKRHLFRMAGEHERYRAGRERCIIHWRGWRICPLVCYDLRFPVWCRNRADCDLIICVANWPAARRYHWRQLLLARAIENQCVVLGVNRVGTDGNRIVYSGDSLAVDARGELLVDAGDRPGSHTAWLDRAALERYRHAFPVALDADDFRLEM